MDVVRNLTAEGQLLEVNSASFMFNTEDLDKLKAAAVEQVEKVLQAGLRFTGSGWSPGRARWVLSKLSGCDLKKPTIMPYRNVWLCTVALVTGAELPVRDLPQDCAIVAFDLAARVTRCSRQEAKRDSAVRFARRKPTSLPRELLFLWERARTGQQQAGLKTLLNNIPLWSNLPPRAPEIAGAGDTTLDVDMRDISQKVLNLLHVQAQLLGKPERQAQLQCWQVTAEVYFGLQYLRKKLARPNLKLKQNSNTLFSNKEVQQHKLLTGLQELCAGAAPTGNTKFSFRKNQNFHFNGRTLNPQQGHPFLFSTGKQLLAQPSQELEAKRSATGGESEGGKSKHSMGYGSQLKGQDGHIKGYGSQLKGYGSQLKGYGSQRSSQGGTSGHGGQGDKLPLGSVQAFCRSPNRSFATSGPIPKVGKLYGLVAGTCSSVCTQSHNPGGGAKVTHR